MNDQVAKPDASLPKAITIVLLLCCAIAIAVLTGYPSQRVNPYVQEVLALTGNPLQGNAIFQINCAGCHGATAAGKVGPSLQTVSRRKSSVKLIEQVISGQTPPMPEFQPSPQEMADLLSYLESL